MYIFIIFILIFLFDIIFTKVNNHRIIKIVLYSLILVFFSYYRSIDFATDTRLYVEFYEMLSRYSFKEILVGTNTLFSKDPIFYVVSKFIQNFGVGYRDWLGIISMIFILSVSKLIYENSPSIFISYLSFVSLGYYYFSMTGLRQTVGLSLVIYSYKYLQNRSFIKFIFCILFASLFHYTALIFLISYLFTKVELKPSYIFIGLFLVIIVNLNPLFIRELLSNFLSQRFNNYIFNPDVLNLSGFYIQLIIFVISFFANSYGFKEVEHKNLLMLSFIGMMFQGFSPIIAEFFRMSMYFSIFNIILIPISIFKLRTIKYRTPVYIFTSIILLLYIYRVGVFMEYQFYITNI